MAPGTARHCDCAHLYGRLFEPPVEGAGCQDEQNPTETAGGIEQGDSDQYDGVIRRLNNSLEEAGYAPLNRDGVLMDKIICDLLECYLNQGNSNSGRTGLKSFTKLLVDFIDAATGGTLDEICTGSRKSTS